MILGRLRFVALALVILFLGGVIWQCQSGDNTKELTADSQSPWLNHADSAYYVGMETCKGCHPDKHETFKHNGMGQSFKAGFLKNSQADFVNPKPVYDKYKDLYYLPFAVDSLLYVKEYRLNTKGDTTHRRIEKIDYIIGSGHHTNSHIMNSNGYLYQIPITYYTQKGKWDLPPGYENGNNTRFGRALGNECLSCHNALPQFDAQSFNRYTFVPLGIDCERCHGPGSVHVNLKKQGILVDTKNDTDFSIVNPAKLPYNLQIDVCQRCHLQGNAVLKPGKSFADFKPGMPLHSIMEVYLPDYGEKDGFIMASHADRLRKSECFIQGVFQNGNKITCISCHNPHHTLEQTSNQLYNQQCLSCHNQKEHPVLAQNTALSNCVDCHMPKSGSIDIPHVTITDHRIGIHKDKAKIQSVENLNAKDLRLLTNSSSKTEELVLAYLLYYERFEPNQKILDLAFQKLKNLPINQYPELHIHYYYLKGDYLKASEINVSTSNQLSAMGYYRLGQSFMNVGNLQNAEKYLQEAVRIQPKNLDFLIKLSRAQILQQKISLARKNLNYIVSEDPKKAEAYNMLGFIALLEQKNELAYQNIKKCLNLEPDNESALLNMVKYYLLVDNLKEADNILKEILRTNPKNTEALQLKKLIMSDNTLSKK
jgi:cytochrome c-type biogenesis protein CcmH/NrfG